LMDSNGITHTPGPCGAVTPQCVDPNLVNPWGLVGSMPVPSPPSVPSPWWISDNGSHKSTLYNDDTVLQTFTINSTVVSIPCPGMPATACGTPTGIVWNPIQASLTSFLVSGTPAKFIWATEDGTIVGWNTGRVIEKDNSGLGAVYKGMEIATNSGTTLLYVTNFNAGTGALLIGNFGDGHINGFNATTGAFIGPMHYGQSTPGFQGKPVVIDGLWALKVGNDHNGKSGYANTLYFTAGPNDEADGLFGALRPDGLYGTPPYPFPGP
jgi:hypothetical protein